MTDTRRPPSHSISAGAPSQAVVDLSALSRNVSFLRDQAGGADVMAVVKADAYRHGASRCALHLEPEVHSFAVATVAEGVSLRKAGIQKEILVFGVPEEAVANTFSQWGLTASISTPEQLKLLPEGTRAHLHIDTGMNRTGLPIEDLNRFLDALTENPSLSVCGVYSHFATAEDPGSKIVHEQYNRFMDARSRFPSDWVTHICNTGAVLHYPELKSLDLIRPGIGLTGYAPGKTVCQALNPVLEWRSRIVEVRHVKKGTPVSYGGTWIADRSGYVATIPVGYADGVPRILSNHLLVQAGKRMRPVVGRITMDFCMAWLGSTPLPTGTLVTLLGGEGWGAGRWALEADSIPHEILCNLTTRVERVYRD
ncbi:MAG: alanine racemase, partial [Balneolaceae bacterium]